MYKIKIKQKKASKELDDFSKQVSKLESNLTEKALDEAHKVSSKILIKHYGLPKKGKRKKTRPSIVQVLRVSHGSKDTLEAQDKPLSLIRFVSGSKIMPGRGLTNVKKKGLKLYFVPGRTWRTKSAFSGVGRGGNRKLFI